MFCAGMTQYLYYYEKEDFIFNASGYQYFIKLQNHLAFRSGIKSLHHNS
jgi:hypothetical protein